MRKRAIIGALVGVTLNKFAKVEVSLEEDILRDVWFPATIVKYLGKGQYLVEYNCSGSNDESALQRVSMHRRHIRPSFPITRTRFCLLEKVDAFYDFGWWSGVITKQLADCRYDVYFKHANKVKEFSSLELRRHVDWKDDMWSNYCEDSDSDDDVHDELRESATLNVTNPIGDTLASIDKQTCVTRSMKRSKATNPGSNDKLITPCKKLKSNGVPSKEVSNQSVDKTKSLLRGKKTPAKQDNSVDLKRPMITSARKKGKLSANSRGPKALVKAAGDLALTTTPNAVKGKRVIKDIPSPVIIGLQCKEMTTASQSKKSKQLISLSPENVCEPEEPQSSVPLASKTTDNQDKETDGDTLMKRKWGKTFRRQPRNRKTSLALNNQNGDANAKKLPRAAKLTLQQAPVKEKQGRSMIGLKIESSPQDLEDLSAKIENEISAIVAKSLDPVSENQPPSRLFPASLEPAEPFQQITAITNSNDQKPSFEKRSSFWETIKSMEAFRLFPQNPHFRPLDNLHEGARERHAIYKMVDFSGVFENMSRLQRDHPRTEIEDELETLMELETHGFDVYSLRNRLMEMLSWKDKWEALETASKEPEDNLETESDKVEERNRDIMAIDYQLDELQKTRERLVKENEESTLKIVAWEKQVDENEAAMRECDRKFCELAFG